jgi:hypothetical protein
MYVVLNYILNLGCQKLSKWLLLKICYENEWKSSVNCYLDIDWNHAQTFIQKQADLTKKDKFCANYNFYSNNKPLCSFLNVKECVWINKCINLIFHDFIQTRIFSRKIIPHYFLKNPHFRDFHLVGLQLANFIIFCINY